MKKTIKFTIAISVLLTLGLTLSACSGKKTSSDDSSGDQPAAATDAGTDAVPPPAADGGGPPPSPDGSAPPPADGAAAPPAGGDAAPAGGAQADAGTPPSPVGSGNFDDYKVQAGDTLMKIAFDTYGDLYRWKGILEANKDKVKDPAHIPAGTTLKVEKPVSAPSVDKNGEKYLIQHGDTLGKISNTVYGTKKKWKSIYENNKQLIHDPNKIFAGFYLYYVPDANSPKPGDNPVTSPAPMAGAAPPANNTATTTGDRAPASNGGPGAPPPH